MIINSGVNSEPPSTRTNNFQPLSLAKKVDRDLDNSCHDEICRGHNLKSPIKSSRRDGNVDEETHLHYKSGVIYDGHIKNNQKFDYGIFLWPNGDVYTGQFYLNLRNGHGS